MKERILNYIGKREAGIIIFILLPAILMASGLCHLADWAYGWGLYLVIFMLGIVVGMVILYLLSC